MAVRLPVWCALQSVSGPSVDHPPPCRGAPRHVRDGGPPRRDNASPGHQKAAGRTPRVARCCVWVWQVGWRSRWWRQRRSRFDLVKSQHIAGLYLLPTCTCLKESHSKTFGLAVFQITLQQILGEKSASCSAASHQSSENYREKSVRRNDVPLTMGVFGDKVAGKMPCSPFTIWGVNIFRDRPIEVQPVGLG